MTSVGALSGLIFLCLLHLHVQAINTAVLAKMIRYFDDNVQPRTKPDVQYAIAISVPKEQCTDESSTIETVFSREDAATVKTNITNQEICALYTNSMYVIAARPQSKHIHAEYRLLYPVGNSPMDKLLEHANENNCVVFYTYNSPCVTKCITGESNILEGLSNWKNKRKEKMNVFVFQKVWQKDNWRKNLPGEFQKLNELVPLHRCNAEQMNCIKCGDNNNKILPACIN